LSDYFYDKQTSDINGFIGGGVAIALTFMTSYIIFFPY
jgi:hypothetical protein